MRGLRNTVANVSKGKMVPAVVVEIMGRFITVRLGQEDRILRGLFYVGGPFVVGQNVWVDYTSGVPIVSGRAPTPLTPAIPPRVRSKMVDPETFVPGATAYIPVSGEGLTKNLSFLNGKYMGFTSEAPPNHYYTGFISRNRQLYEGYVAISPNSYNTLRSLKDYTIYAWQPNVGPRWGAFSDYIFSFDATEYIISRGNTLSDPPFITETFYNPGLILSQITTIIDQQYALYWVFENDTNNIYLIDMVNATQEFLVNPYQEDVSTQLNIFMYLDYNDILHIFYRAQLSGENRFFHRTYNLETTILGDPQDITTTPLSGNDSTWDTPYGYAWAELWDGLFVSIDHTETEIAEPHIENPYWRFVYVPWSGTPISSPVYEMYVDDLAPYNTLLNFIPDLANNCVYHLSTDSISGNRKVLMVETDGTVTKLWDETGLVYITSGKYNSYLVTAAGAIYSLPDLTLLSTLSVSNTRISANLDDETGYLIGRSSAGYLCEIDPATATLTNIASGFANGTRLYPSLVGPYVFYGNYNVAYTTIKPDVPEDPI